MQFNEELYMRFPVNFREKLLDGSVVFEEGTKVEYEKILVYRAVERRKDDYRPVDKSDFKSHFELGKKVRGVPIEKSLSDPSYYSASSFTNQEIVRQLLHFPRPTKKMAKGYVYQEGGPQYTTGTM